MIIRRTLHVLLWIIFIPVAFFSAATWDWWWKLLNKKTWWAYVLFAILVPIYVVCWVIVQASEWWVALVE